MSARGPSWRAVSASLASSNVRSRLSSAADGAQWGTRLGHQVGSSILLLPPGQNSDSRRACEVSRDRSSDVEDGGHPGVTKEEAGVSTGFHFEG